MFELSEFDRALCEGAYWVSNTQNNEDSNTVVIPQIGVYGQYISNQEINVICRCEYYYCYDLDPNAEDYNFPDFGLLITYGRAVLQEESDGAYSCVSFELADSDEYLEWLEEMCGPLSDLPEKIMAREIEPVCTFPSVFDMLSQYFDFLECEKEEKSF